MISVIGILKRLTASIMVSAAVLAFGFGCSSPEQKTVYRESDTREDSQSSAQALTKTFGTHEAAECMARILGQDANRPVDAKKASAIDSLSFPLYAQQYSECAEPMGRVKVLRGLESLPDLKYLDVSSMGNLSQLSDLTQMKHLEQINIYGTSISNVSDLSGISTLSQVALNAHVCDLNPLAGLPLKSITVECATADISMLNGKNMQIYMPSDADKSMVKQSVQSGNMVTVRNPDGSFELYQLVDGTVKSSRM